MNTHGEAVQVLSRSAGVAESDEFGRGVLSRNARFSTRRAIRPYCSDPTSGRINGGQHCRRARPREHGLVHSLSANCSGLDEGAGNAFNTGPQGRPPDSGTTGKLARPKFRGGQDVEVFDSLTRGKATFGLRAQPHRLTDRQVRHLFAIRYSLFATSHA